MALIGAHVGVLLGTALRRATLGRSLRGQWNRSQNRQCQHESQMSFHDVSQKARFAFLITLPGLLKRSV